MLKTKKCSDCGRKFTPRGRRSHRCDSCHEANEKRASAMYRETAKMRLEIIVSSPKCARCGCTDIGILEVDHIKPLSKGGTNDRSNLQVLCALCNLSKFDYEVTL